MNKEIIEFSDQIRSLVSHSERATKSAVESINVLQSSIDEYDRKVKQFVKIINSKKNSEDNLNKAANELDSFVNLCNTLEYDLLKIEEGPRGSVSEYIVKLEYLKSVDKYLWYKDLKFSDRRQRKNENNVKVSLDRHVNMLKIGENFICFEFQNILKHNCNLEQMKYYIEFIIDKYIDSKELFIPNSTIKKLELICAWFLKREMSYELYDDNDQHCEINQKLKYDIIRFSFLSTTIQTYFKISSVGLVKDPEGKFRLNIQKVIQKLSEHSGRLTNSLFSDDTDYKRISRFSSQMSLNLENVSPNASASVQLKVKTDQKPVELIEIFSENLDFCLKLLSHENELIKKIYAKSSDTQTELISKLTVLVIGEIQKECELFFKNSLDFTKFTNISDNVIHSITRLKIKIKNLIETTSCIQTNDLKTGSSIIQFSLKLNEIASQIFQTYLSVVQTGYLNTSEVPSNSTVHPYCIKICETWAFMRHNESFLIDTIILVCDSIEKSGKRKSRLVDVDQPDKWYFSKYYSLLIEKLDNFLIDCTVKFCESNKLDFITPVSNLQFSISSSFAKHLKSLKGFVFLVNNLAYLFDFLYEMNMIEDLKQINEKFEDIMKSNIENNITNSLQIFKYLHTKWSRMVNEEQLTNENNIMSLIKRTNSDDKLSKRKKEYLFYLKETILNSFCLVVQNEALNEIFKAKAFEHLKPIFDWMELSDELKTFYDSLNVKSIIHKNRSIFEVLYDQMFPSNSIHQLNKFI